jgi:peptidyl-prolyl cis-trans isomerase B (cyclophilin B)
MIGRLFITFFFAVMFSATCTFGQTPSPEPPSPPGETREPAKANARPRVPSQAIPEPFDNTDVKTMATKCVRLETEAGDIDIELYPESAPESVRNFLNLTATGAFDTTTFSRVVPDFVIQGGDLYTREVKITLAMALRSRQPVPDEPNKILHERSVVSLARGDEPNTASTHFFILVKAERSLDGKFAAFGRVTGGMNVVDAINKAAVDGEKPVKPVRIRKANVMVCTAKP